MSGRVLPVPTAAARFSPIGCHGCIAPASGALHLPPLIAAGLRPQGALRVTARAVRPRVLADGT